MLLFLCLLLVVVSGQAPLFAPLQTNIDGLFDVKRAYFKPLDSVEDCDNFNNGDCLNSFFPNAVNVLFVEDSDPNNPDSALSEVIDGVTYVPSFQVSDNSAIIVGGFATALADRISITPFAKYVQNDDGQLIKAFAPVGVCHSYANDYFVTVLSSNQGMIDAALEWFCNTGATELTTAICLNYFVQSPFVANDGSKNLNENTYFSVVFRTDASNGNSYELFKTFSQSPALQAWVVTATDSNPISSNPFTSLNDLLASSSGGSSCNCKERVLPYEDCLPFDKFDDMKELIADTPVIDDCLKKRSRSKGGKGRSRSSSSQSSSDSADSNREEEFGCRGYAANEIVFSSKKAFETKTNLNGIFVEGINHLTTGNALYFSVNLVNDKNRQVLARASSSDLDVAKPQYGILFASEAVCEENSDLLASSTQISFVCVAIDLEEKSKYRIEEVSVTSVIDVKLCEKNLKAPNVYLVAAADEGPSTTPVPPNTTPGLDPRPHIVFVAVDDLGWKDVGYNGAEYVTPNIDSLAGDGIILNRYYATPVCTPTRACLFTGRYSFRSNMTFPVLGADPRFLPFDTPLLSEMLQMGGYDTHMVGKWHLGQVYFGNGPLRRGFDSFYGILGGVVHMYDKDETIHWDSQVGNGSPFSQRSLELLNLLFPEQYSIYDWFDGEMLNFEEGYGTRQLITRAESVIESHDTNRPLFLYVSSLAPHDPIVLAPDGPTGYPECAGISNQGRFMFCTMVQELDRGLGAIVSKLQERGMWDNTLIIFTSDNGGQAPVPFLDLPGFGVNLPLRGTKGTVWEGAMRVLSFVSGGVIPQALQGSVNEQCFHVVDWYKTLLTLAQIPTDGIPFLDSLNVWPAILSPDQSVPTPRVEFPYLAAPIDTLQMSMTIGHYKLILNANADMFVPFDGYWNFDGFTPAPGQGVDHTFLLDIWSDEEETNNLESDPIAATLIPQLQGRLYEIIGQGFVPTTVINTPEGYVINTLTGTALPYLEIIGDTSIRFV